MRRYTEAQIRQRILTIMGRSTQKEMASVMHVSPQYLSDFLRGKREPGPAILKCFGLRKEIQYVEETKA